MKSDYVSPEILGLYWHFRGFSLGIYFRVFSISGKDNNMNENTEIDKNKEKPAGTHTR